MRLLDPALAYRPWNFSGNVCIERGKKRAVLLLSYLIGFSSDSSLDLYFDLGSTLSVLAAEILIFHASKK